MPSVEIVGVHPIQGAQGYFGQELGLVVLVEAWIRDRDDRLKFGGFGQSEGVTLGPQDQVAYDEVFLSDDGSAVAAHDLRPLDASDLRVAFFLHFYEASRPILTSYGPVHAPDPTPLPERLSKLITYEPVD